MRPPAVRLSHSNFVLWIIAASSLLLLGVMIAVYDLWQQATFYVSSDYAQVAGSITDVVTPGAVLISDVYADLGGHVDSGQAIVQVQPADGLGQSHDLVAPQGGVVVGLYAREGQLTFDQQPVASIAEPSDLWVVANYAESALGPVRVGQPAEVQLVVIDRKLAGHVAEIMPDSYAAGASDLGVVTVPVRISVDGNLSGLYPGMAAYVKIRVR